LPQPLAAHLIIEGTDLNVVVHRDRIEIRAHIIQYEIGLIQGSRGDLGDDPDKQLAAYCEYLVSHLHVSADGTVLTGKVLKVIQSKDPKVRPVCEMEFRSSSPAIWPGGAKSGKVVITHDMLNVPDGSDLSSYVGGLIYKVHIRQEGQPAEESQALAQGGELSFSCDWGASSSASNPPHEVVGPAVAPGQTTSHWFNLPSVEYFMDVVKSKSLSFAAIVLAVLAAMVWGAGHSLTPGHGKSIVGAYLVGSRGTPAHAIYLSLTVTATHTIAVYTLGLIAEVATQYVDPLALLPWLNVAAGLIVLAMGAFMLVQRTRSLFGGLVRHRAHLSDHAEGHSHDTQPHDHDHPHEHGHSHEHDQAQEPDHAQEHGHDHPHDHDHGHDHDDHPHDHHHDEHGHGHSHLPPGADGAAVTWRSLLGLGIASGLLPCPAALVLLLTAISLNRVGLGLLLVFAFSVGLAVVLTVVGLLFIKGSRLLPESPWIVAASRYLPALSALIIFVIGLFITWYALYPLVKRTGLV
jgi:ABC-type nickel/cobalt efflux system permease component RcnA